MLTSEYLSAFKDKTSNFLKELQILDEAVNELKAKDSVLTATRYQLLTREQQISKKEVFLKDKELNLDREREAIERMNRDLEFKSSSAVQRLESCDRRERELKILENDINKHKEELSSLINKASDIDTQKHDINNALERIDKEIKADRARKELLDTREHAIEDTEKRLQKMINVVS